MDPLSMAMAKNEGRVLHETTGLTIFSAYIIPEEGSPEFVMGIRSLTYVGTRFTGSRYRREFLADYAKGSLSVGMTADPGRIRVHPSSHAHILFPGLGTLTSAGWHRDGWFSKVVFEAKPVAFENVSDASLMSIGFMVKSVIGGRV